MQMNMSERNEDVLLGDYFVDKDQVQLINQALTQKSSSIKSSFVNVKKMNPCQTYFALIKAYCAINVLLLPKAFKNGGYILSPIALIVSCFFESFCAIKLS